MTVTFEKTDYSVTEDVGMREVCIVKNLETTIAITASYFTTEGTALGNRHLLFFVQLLFICTRHCVETVFLSIDYAGYNYR